MQALPLNVVTVTELSQLTQVNKSAIEKRINKGIIPSDMQGGRIVVPLDRMYQVLDPEKSYNLPYLTITQDKVRRLRNRKQLAAHERRLLALRSKLANTHEKATLRRATIQEEIEYYEEIIEGYKEHV